MSTSGSSTGSGSLPPIPPDIALTTGPTMLGILLNWGFMGILVAQIYYYHMNFPGDSRKIRILVYSLGTLDTLQTALVTADAFHWFVFGFGNMKQLNDTFLNSWDVPFLDSIISLIVQAFYCWRIYVLRKRSFIFPVIILAVSLTQCGAGIATAVIAHKLGELSLISTEVVEQTIWLVGSVLADVMITVVLTWTLLRSRASELPSSNSMLSRIVRLTVETNCLTAGVAVISLILFLGVPQHSTLVVPPTAVIGKLYSNCLVAVLNSRQLKSSTSSRRLQLGSSSSSSGPNHIHSFRLTEINSQPHGLAEDPLKVQVLQEVQSDQIELGNVTWPNRLQRGYHDTSTDSTPKKRMDESAK